MTELIIGMHSFEEYTLCIIKELPSLERIEMGAIGKVSNNFYHASLELKSECCGRRCDGRTAFLGAHAFKCCRTVVFKGMAALSF